jgi:hypothetical protein
VRVFVVLLGVAGACREQGEQASAESPPPPPPAREAFGAVIDGMPTVRVGNGYVTAVSLADGDVALRALVDGRSEDLERFTPRECPVIDLGDAYFVHGDTCSEFALEFALGWISPPMRLECDELSWDGVRIVVARRTQVQMASELPRTCR